MFPSNWKTTGAKVSDTWYVQIYFIDSLYSEKYPKGKQVRLKVGINHYTKVSEKRESIKQIMELYDKLFNEGYYPITNFHRKPEHQEDTVQTIVTTLWIGQGSKPKLKTPLTALICIHLIFV